MRRPPPQLKYSKSVASLTWLGVGSLLLSACFSAGDGIDPPPDRVYFPVGLAITHGGKFLAVANSDFDLQYNAGTLQVLGLEELRKLVPKPCASASDCLDPDRPEQRCDLEPSQENGLVPSHVCVNVGEPNAGKPCGAIPERAPADQLLYPGRCDAVALADPPVGDSLIVSSVEIGAFATDVLARKTPTPGEERLFVPVRGDATLHWLDVDADGRIDCGQGFARGACDDRHRAGNDPDEENSRDLRLDPEPFALDATADGSVILVTNQASGRVALFEDGNIPEGPRLAFTLSDLPTRPVGVAELPTPAGVVLSDTLSEPSFPPGFLVSFRNAPEVHLIRYFADNRANPDRGYLTRPRATAITLNSIGSDSRGIAVDASSRTQAELGCALGLGLQPDCALDENCARTLRDAGPAEVLASYQACLNAAATTPVDVYVANRSPASLLVGRTTPALSTLQSNELPTFYDTIALAQGPSRVVVGDVIVGTGADQEPVYERRVFVVCFDSRRVFVYDPLRRRIETEITTGRGPHALALDTANGLLYVGHFTDSFIGVVSLDWRFPYTYGKTLATIGTPTPPRASK